MIPFWLGDYYEQKMENTQDEDKISQWRNARLFYRQAQIAFFWMWLPVEKRKRNIDNHLSQSMYEIILIGESGAFDATQHLDFIQSREDTLSWQEGATEALYRYGDCDDIIENYENKKNTSHSQKVQQLTMFRKRCNSTSKNCLMNCILRKWVWMEWHFGRVNQKENMVIY